MEFSIQGIADLPLLRIVLASPQNSHQPRNDKLFCFMRIIKCGNFQNLFATIISLSELPYRRKSFIILVQEKEPKLKIMEMNEA